MKLQSKGSASGFNSLGTPRSRRYRGPHSLHQSGFSIRARRFASRMISRIDSLASQPESGSWLPEDDGRQKWKADSNQWQSPLQDRGNLSLTIEEQFVIARSLECDQASSGPSGRGRTASPAGRDHSELQSQSGERSVAGQNLRVWSGASHQDGQRAPARTRGWSGSDRRRPPVPDSSCNGRAPAGA